MQTLYFVDFLFEKYESAPLFNFFVFVYLKCKLNEYITYTIMFVFIMFCLLQKSIVYTLAFAIQPFVLLKEFPNKLALVIIFVVHQYHIMFYKSNFINYLQLQI